MADEKIITGTNDEEIWQKLSSDLAQEDVFEYNVVIVSRIKPAAFHKAFHSAKVGLQAGEDRHAQKQDQQVFLIY